MKFPVMGIEESARQKCIPLITYKKCYNDKCMALQLQMLQIVYHFEKKYYKEDAGHINCMQFDTLLVFQITMG